MIFIWKRLAIGRILWLLLYILVSRARLVTSATGDLANEASTFCKRFACLKMGPPLQQHTMLAVL